MRLNHYFQGSAAALKPYANPLVRQKLILQKLDCLFYRFKHPAEFLSYNMMILLKRGCRDLLFKSPEYLTLPGCLAANPTGGKMSAISSVRYQSTETEKNIFLLSYFSQEK